MAEENKSNSTKDFIWFMVIIIVVGFIWVASGGPEGEHGGLFEPSRVSPTALYETPDSSSTTEEIQDYYEDKINLYKKNVLKTDLDEEYIEITTSKSNDKSVSLAGWSVENKEGFNLEIPQAVNLFFSGETNIEEYVILPPGGKIVITSGKSPVGYGFRLNKCSGYLDSYDPTPSISKECPYIKDAGLSTRVSDACLDFVEDISRCWVPSFSYDESLELGSTCIDAINDVSGYNNCVDLYRNDDDFYKDEWRIYLSRSQEFWKDSHDAVIILRDENDKVIKEVSY